MASDGASSQLTEQFSPLAPTPQLFFTPTATFPMQTSDTPRGLTNRNRRRQLSPSIVESISQKSSSSENDNSFQLDQSAISSTTKKRNSADIAIRPLKPKKRPRNPLLLTCSDPACHNRSFADEPNLQRHAREVHGTAQYYCPLTTCERHVRGFKRRDNCVNHQKRSHGGLLSPLQGGQQQRQQQQEDEGDEARMGNGDQRSLLGGRSAGAEEREGQEEVESVLRVGLEEGGGKERAEGEGELAAAAASGGVMENGVKGAGVPAEVLMRKMDNLRALFGRKKRIEEEIARASVELQEALRP